MSPESLLNTSFPNLKLFAKGKVRDIYEVGDHLLLVSTDRISAFDVIMNEGIPHKGLVLT
ncbi:MAG: phosphoribosylaminoimidazolesuccinocarboxamide synthase, partial [Ignavibacteria bacterium]|nr:phosphoribosylaminoimidazolesuccinocarboxamide synthase [Ignavibacteria bacterium]